MSRLLSAYFLSLLAACAVMQPAAGPSPRDAASGVDAATTGAGSGARAAGIAADGVGGGGSNSPGIQDPELEATFDAVWREPSFQRALAESYLRGSEVEPQITQREAQFRTEVLTLIQDKRFDDAISRLQSLQGDNAVFDFMLGNIYFGQSNFGDAAREYTKAVATKSNYRRAWKNLALSQVRNGSFEAARDAFVRVLTLGGASPQTYSGLGFMHTQLGDYMAAEKAFEIAMMLEPQQERWRIMLAEVLYAQERYAEVATLTASLLEKDPSNPDLWLRQASAYAGMNDTKKASENLEIAEQLGGSNRESLNLLGTIYFNDGLFELATDAYLRSLMKGELGDHRALLDVAKRLAARSAYRESKRLVEGLEAAYLGKLDAASMTELRKLRARLASASGATEEHVALLEQICKDNPLDGDALIQLGNHYQSNGNSEKAMLRYEQAARNGQFGTDARIMHAQLLVSLDRFGEALPLLRQANAERPRDDLRKLLEFVERSSRGK